MLVRKDQYVLGKREAVFDADEKLEYAKQSDLTDRPLTLPLCLLPHIPGGNEAERASIDPYIANLWNFSIYAIEGEVVAWKFIASPGYVVLFCDLLSDALYLRGIL